MSKQLPRGQQVRDDFPRFGVWNYASYRPKQTDTYEIIIGGDMPALTINQDDLNALERVEQTSDFHCVTTWTYCDAQWSGYRFNDVYETFIRPNLPSDYPIKLVLFRGKDHFKSPLTLEDALAEEILLADQLDGQPLSAKHGAPIRLVAPAHYGYKSVKHLHKIEVLHEDNLKQSFRQRLMNHPRGRVEFEERGGYLPNWMLRYIWRSFIGITVRRMKLD